MEIVNATGRRKAAVARVYLSEGKGNITVNDKDYREYFNNDTLNYYVTQPLILLNVAEKYDITAT
jgi:small subunit ribosomal protein S9